jgi:hypothetical protein
VHNEEDLDSVQDASDHEGSDADNNDNLDAERSGDMNIVEDDEDDSNNRKPVDKAPPKKFSFTLPASQPMKPIGTASPKNMSSRVRSKNTEDAEPEAPQAEQTITVAPIVINPTVVESIPAEANTYEPKDKMVTNEMPAGSEDPDNNGSASEELSAKISVNGSEDKGHAGGGHNSSGYV